MDKKQEQFEKAMSYVERYLKGIDAIDTGLMKTHEVVSTAQLKVEEGFNFVMAKLYDASEKLEHYRDDIWEAVQVAEDNAYPATDAPVQDEIKVDNPTPGNIVKATEDMSRDEKIAYIREQLGEPDASRISYDGWDNLALTNGVDYLKMRRAHEQS